MLLNSTIIGQGKALIIAHGYFGMGDNWKAMATRFANNFEVHVLDLRNHGRSFHSDDFNYDLMVEDLYKYINHYQLESIALLGHSMGGKLAMLFAVSFPELVSKLIVVDISPKYYPPHHDFILNALNKVDFNKITSRREIAEILKTDIDDESVVQFLLKNVYWKTKTQLAYRFNLKSLTENNNEVSEPLPAFTSFDKSSLFLKGENSGYISKDDEALIKNHFPKAYIVSIKKSGHWIHADNPEDFYKEVSDFLKA
jgi:pimeloyl-ACP methyl ester carboxylesterase